MPSLCSEAEKREPEYRYSFKVMVPMSFRSEVHQVSTMGPPGPRPMNENMLHAECSSSLIREFVIAGCVP